MELGGYARVLLAVILAVHPLAHLLDGEGMLGQVAIPLVIALVLLQTWDAPRAVLSWLKKRWLSGRWQRFTYALQVLFIMPLMPLAVALSFTVPIDAFHYFTEPLLREVHSTGELTTYMQATLITQILLVVLLMIPIGYLLAGVSAFVTDIFHSFFANTGADRPLGQFHLKLVLTSFSKMKMAFLVLTCHIVTMVSVLSLPINSSEKFMKNSMWLHSAIVSAASIISFEYDADKTTEEIVGKVFELTRVSHAAVTILTAAQQTSGLFIAGSYSIGVRHFIAYFLGCGTLLSVENLVIFVLLRFMCQIMAPVNLGVKTAANWCWYIGFVGFVTLVLLAAFPHEEAVAVVNQTYVLVCGVALFVGGFLVKWGPLKHGHRIVCAVYCIPLVLNGFNWTCLVQAAVIFSTQTYFLKGYWPFGASARDPCTEVPVFPKTLRSFFKLLTYPLWGAVCVIVVLSVIAVSQETDPLSNKGFFEATSFTEHFVQADPTREPNCNPTSRTPVTWASPMPDSPDCYQVCNERWSGLDVMDLSYAAMVAYINMSSDGEGGKVLEFMNHPAHRGEGDGEGDWTIRYTNVMKSDDFVSFVDLYSPSRDVSVLAVRGSSPRAVDWIQDLAMFGEGTIFSILSHLVPALGFWPPGFFHSFLAVYTELVGRVMGSRSQFYTPLIRYAKKSLKKSPRELVFVGHSLGGALAKIGGTLAGKRAVGVSSPGIFDSRKKFTHEELRVNSYDIRRLVTNVNNDGDFVPMVGSQGGAVHNLYCADGAACHGIMATLCELWTKCPNGATGRQFVGSVMRSLNCSK